MIAGNKYIGASEVIARYIGDTLVWEKSSPSGYNVQLTLDGTPTNVSFAPLKYGKFGALSLDWDDGVISSITASNLLETTTYSDGTGKNIPWRAGVAVIGRSSFNDVELGITPESNSIQYTDMQSLIGKGWDIMNHGLYSNSTGNFTSATPLDDIQDLDTLILDRISYVMNSTVVPSNETGYVTGAQTAGHISVTSQNDNVGDTITPIPEAQWMPITDMATWTPGFKYLLRSFTDTWDYATEFQDRIDDLLTSTASVNKLFRIGTHDSSPTGFSDFVSYMQTNSSGNIWVASMREIVEYYILSTQATISVNGSSVNVQVPEGLRWEDFSLVIDGATVTGATCSEADDITFSDNLVNVYKDNSIS